MPVLYLLYPSFFFVNRKFKSPVFHGNRPVMMGILFKRPVHSSVWCNFFVTRFSKKITWIFKELCLCWFSSKRKCRLISPLAIHIFFFINFVFACLLSSSYWRMDRSFVPYFIHYLRRSIILLNVIVDHFETGPDHRLDNFCLDQTRHWSAPYSKFSWRVKNKGLKMDRSGPLQWTNLQLDQTQTGPFFFWTGPHTGTLFSGPNHTLYCPIFQISWGSKNKGL